MRMEAATGDDSPLNQAGRDIVNIYINGIIPNNVQQLIQNWQTILDEDNLIVEYQTINVCNRIFRLQNDLNKDCVNIILIGGIFYKSNEDITFLTDFIINLIRQNKIVYFIQQNNQEAFYKIFKTIVQENIIDNRNQELMIDIFLDTIAEIERCHAEIISIIKSDESLQLTNYVRFTDDSVVFCNHHGFIYDYLTVNDCTYQEKAFSYAINFKDIIRSRFSIRSKKVSVYQYRNAFVENLYEVCKQNTSNHNFKNCTISFGTLVNLLEEHIINYQAQR